MKKVTRNVIEENDYDLLNEEYEANPCAKCPVFKRENCPGCAKYDDYTASIEKLVDHGILNLYSSIACTRDSIKKLLPSIKLLSDSLDSISSTGADLSRILGPDFAKLKEYMHKIVNTYDNK